MGVRRWQKSREGVRWGELRFSDSQERRLAYYHPLARLATSWNTAGTKQEPSWNQAGTKLEPSWNRAGTKLELCWNRAGTELEPSWNRAGAKLEPSWNQAGSQLEPSWDQARAELEPSWNPTGTQLEPNWDRAGAQLEPSWNPAGTQLEPSWNPTGTELESSCWRAGSLACLPARLPARLPTYPLMDSPAPVLACLLPCLPACLLHLFTLLDLRSRVLIRTEGCVCLAARPIACAEGAGRRESNKGKALQVAGRAIRLQIHSPQASQTRIQHAQWMVCHRLS